MRTENDNIFDEKPIDVFNELRMNGILNPLSDAEIESFLSDIKNNKNKNLPET